MTRIGSKLITVAAAWVALCSAAFAADPQSAQTPSPQTPSPQTPSPQAPSPQVLSASAGEPLPTAAPAGGAVSTSNDDQTARQIDAWLAGDGSGAGAPQGGPASQGAPPPRAIHGEAGVAFGSSGYRDAYVAADIPVGDRSDLGVAVSDTKLPSHHGFGGGEYKSLGISLNIDASKGGHGDCGPPHWGEPLPGDRPNCVAPDGEAAGLAPGLAAMEAQAQR